MRPLWVIALVLVAPLIVVATSEADEAAQAARINGAPTVTRANKSEPLRRGDTVMVGDVIETDRTSKVKILLADDSILDIGPQSRVLLQAFMLTPARREVRVEVLLGKFKLAVSKFLTGETDYGVRTPSAVAGVRGTVLWGDTERDLICALDGTIEVAARSGDTNPARLSAGECVNQMKAGKTTPLKPSAAEVAAYLKEVTLE
ncbi:MAG TPA: FecR family protein [Candidatus Kryptonia bacterium]|nr:FecR family protein [Candidatus Kryptonia bacterium]